jgi:hypothetical protein
MEIDGATGEIEVLDRVVRRVDDESDAVAVLR